MIPAAQPPPDSGADVPPNSAKPTITPQGPRVYSCEIRERMKPDSLSQMLIASLITLMFAGGAALLGHVEGIYIGLVVLTITIGVLVAGRIRDRWIRKLLSAVGGSDFETQLSLLADPRWDVSNHADLVRLLRQVVLDGHCGTIVRLIGAPSIMPVRVPFEPIALHHAGAAKVTSDGDTSLPDESKARGGLYQLLRLFSHSGRPLAFSLLLLTCLLFMTLVVGIPTSTIGGLGVVICVPLYVGLILQLLLQAFGRRWWVVNGAVFRRLSLGRGGIRAFRAVDSVLAVHRRMGASSTGTSFTVVDARGHDQFTATPVEAEFVLNAWTSPLPPPTDEMLEQWL